MRRIASLLLLLAPASFGYVRYQVALNNGTGPLVRVDNTAIQFYLNDQIVAGLQSSASGNAVTVITSDSNPQAAVRAALDTWNAVSTANIHFLPLQSTTAGIDNSDFQATIAFGTTPAEISAFNGAIALTAYSYPTSPANRGPAGGPMFVSCSSNCTYPAGGIADSDILLNPVDTFSTTGAAGSYDLQATITHELGHSLGANHTGLLGAVMFQFPSNRFLTTDDLAFVTAVYPLPGGPAALGTIGGTVTVAGGGSVPYALLTAFDTSAGVTVGGITAPDGTYSFAVPPGNYQVYAEPLNGVLPINVYLTLAQAALAAGTTFQTTMYSGSLTVTANDTSVANIAVTPGASSFVAPVVAVTPVNGNISTGVVGGPATVPSGQSVDLILAGAGFDSTLSDSNFAFYGQGVSLKPGSVRVDNTQSFNGFNILRATLVVAARTSPELASFVVTKGSNTLSFSGALVVVPPTPAFVSAGVVSAAPYAGIQGGVSPGGIYSIYDIPNVPNLGPAALVQNAPSYDAYGNIATTLAGVTVTFDGVPAPMFLSWGNQLNFQVPFEVAGKTSTQVAVNYLGSASAAVAVPVLPAQPLFFTSDGTAVRAYNVPAYVINSAQNPAPAGSYVEIYGTGAGNLGTLLVTGHGMGAPSVAGNYTYSIDGSPAAPAAFGGWTSGSVGLAQWDLLIPKGTPSGAASVTVTDTVTGISSHPGTTIFVQ